MLQFDWINVNMTVFDWGVFSLFRLEMLFYLLQLLVFLLLMFFLLM